MAVPGGQLGAAMRAHEEAVRLHHAFSDGETLALFECLAFWRREGLPLASLPEWAIEAWADIGACYYDDGITARIEGQPLPSLEKIAGLGGVKKQRSAWDAVDHEHKARSYAAAHRLLVAKARGEPPPPYYHVRDWNRIRVPKVNVPVLNSRNEPTQAFSVALAKRFGILGNSDNAIYKTARRLLRLADK